MIKAQNFSIEALGFFGVLIFASILLACSLEILSTKNPLPAAPPPPLELSSKKFKDLN